MQIGEAVRLSRIVKRGKILLLAYDQGMEHGPSDFNEKNTNPEYVLDIAKKGRYTGVVLQKGVAKHYFENYAGDVPLVLKLNGRTNLVPKDEIYSPPVASVKDAVNFGADAIGYTIYVGSPQEARMFSDFAQIEKEARDYGIPIILWAYPRGKHVQNEKSPETISYAARTALELGANIVKVNYTGSVESFRHVVQAAQKTLVISAGGSKQTDAEFIEKAKEVMRAGAAGFAVGRNVWQNENPMKITEELRKAVFGKVE